MITFSIKKQNNEIILFNQKCGAPVKRIGVESFKLFIPTDNIINNDVNFINNYLEFLKSCYVWCEYKGIETFSLSEKELKNLQKKYDKKNIKFTYNIENTKFTYNIFSHIELTDRNKIKDYHVFYFDVKKNYKIFGLNENLIDVNGNIYNLYLLTCVRYLQKDYGFNIPEIALKLSEKFTKWQKIKCLQLAHYPFNKKYNSFYSLLYENYFSIPITNEELIEKLIINKFTINNVFGSKKINLCKITRTELKQLFEIYNNLSLSNLNNYLLLKRKLESFESNKILDICSENYDYLDDIDSSFIFQDNLKNKNNE